MAALRLATVGPRPASVGVSAASPTRNRFLLLLLAAFYPGFSGSSGADAVQLGATGTSFGSGATPVRLDELLFPDASRDPMEAEQAAFVREELDAITKSLRAALEEMQSDVKADAANLRGVRTELLQELNFLREDLLPAPMGAGGAVSTSSPATMGVDEDEDLPWGGETDTDEAPALNLQGDSMGAEGDKDEEQQDEERNRGPRTRAAMRRRRGDTGRARKNGRRRNKMQEEPGIDYTPAVAAQHQPLPTREALLQFAVASAKAHMSNHQRAWGTNYYKLKRFTSTVQGHAQLLGAVTEAVVARWGVDFASPHSAAFRVSVGVRDWPVFFQSEVLVALRKEIFTEAEEQKRNRWGASCLANLAAELAGEREGLPGAHTAATWSGRGASSGEASGSRSGLAPAAASPSSASFGPSGAARVDVVAARIPVPGDPEAQQQVQVSRARRSRGRGSDSGRPAAASRAYVASPPASTSGCLFAETAPPVASAAPPRVNNKLTLRDHVDLEQTLALPGRAPQPRPFLATSPVGPFPLPFPAQSQVHLMNLPGVVRGGGLMPEQRPGEGGDRIMELLGIPPTAYS